MKIVQPTATAAVAASLHFQKWKQYTIMIQLGFPQAHELKCITMLGYTSPEHNGSVTVLAEPGK